MIEEIKNTVKKIINTEGLIFTKNCDFYTFSIISELFWICRFNNSSIILPYENYKGLKVLQINSVKDIYNNSELLKDAFRCAINSHNKSIH